MERTLKMDYLLNIKPNSILSIVKMSVVPSYANSNIAQYLFKDYVFVFNTALVEDSNLNGFTEVSIVPVNDLRLFNPYVRKCEKYEYTGGNLVISEFLKISEQKTDHEIKYIATLKNQHFKFKDSDAKITLDKQILLLTHNGDSEGRCDNIPVLQLGPEFEKQLKYCEYKKRERELVKVKMYLKTLKYGNEKYNDEIAKTYELVQKELINVRLKSEEFFQSYLEMKKDIYYPY